MNPLRLLCCLLLCLVWFANGAAWAQPKEIPPALEPWKNWVLWGELHPDCPTPFHTNEQHLCVWPSRLSLNAGQEKGSWQIQVRAFETAWLGLPGDRRIWPVNVRVNEEVVPVVERNGVPSVRLPAGVHQLAGEFQWSEMPQRISVPQQIGVLSLVVDGEAVPIPNWGRGWPRLVKALACRGGGEGSVGGPNLSRDRGRHPALAANRDRLDRLGQESRRTARLDFAGRLAAVTGREPHPRGGGRSGADEGAGAGRELANSGSCFPQHGSRRVSIRLGRPTCHRCGAGRLPRQAGIRIAELDGVQAVDVNQTTFPDQWRALPVFEWPTNTAFRLVEKMRGMGMAAAARFDDRPPFLVG